MTNKIIDEKQAVKKKFLEYSATFEKLVQDEDTNLILPFFHIPAILIAPNQAPVALESEAKIKGVFTQLVEQLKEQTFDRSELNTLSVKVLSNEAAIVSGTATRYKTDKTVLEKFGFTYTLYKTDKNWKIIAGIIHDTETALQLE